MTTRDVLKAKELHIFGDVLDLGAGDAKYKNLISATAQSYTAFDVVDNEKIDVVGDIHHLPFKNDSFDTIVCTQVFEHINKPWEVVPEIKRVLKSGGKIILTAPFMIPYHAHPYDFYRYTTEGMRDLFEGELAVLECNKYGSFWTVISEVVRFRWLSPYEDHGRFKKKLMLKLISFLMHLDRSDKVHNVYANVYLIAQK